MRSKNKRNEDSNVPSKKVKTTSGREVKSNLNSDYVYPKLEKKTSSGFHFGGFFPTNQFIPVLATDDFNIKSALYESQVTQILSPSKTKPVMQPDGSYALETKTPRKRQFNPIGEMRAKDGANETHVTIWQEPGTAEQRFNQHPPVLRHSPNTVKEKNITPPSNSIKKVEFVINDRNLRKSGARKTGACKKLPFDVSANSYKNSFSNENLNAKNAWCHMAAASMGGDNIPENLYAGTEGCNLSTLGLGESHVYQLVSKGTAVKLTATVKLQNDKNGNPTHIGCDSHINKWESIDGKKSVELKLDPQNPEIAVKGAVKMSKLIFQSVFSSANVASQDASSQTEDSVSSSDLPTTHKPS